MYIARVTFPWKQANFVPSLCLNPRCGCNLQNLFDTPFTFSPFTFFTFYFFTLYFFSFYFFHFIFLLAIFYLRSIIVQGMPSLMLRINQKRYRCTVKHFAKIATNAIIVTVAWNTNSLNTSSMQTIPTTQQTSLLIFLTCATQVLQVF